MKTKFPYRMWRWTGGDESLFDLDKDALKAFEILCNKAGS